MFRPLTMLVLASVALAGCGEEPTIRTYDVRPAVAYNWPETEEREGRYEEGGVTWVWTVPAGWADAPEVPDQLVADYRFPGVTPELPGRMTVSVLPGDGGGVLANVSRWRQQLFVTQVKGLGPNDVLSRPMGAPWGELTVVELHGLYQGPTAPSHIRAAILQVPAEGGGVFQTWAFKMTGDQATLDRNWMNLSRVFLSFRPEGADPIELPEDFFALAPAGDDRAGDDADASPEDEDDGDAEDGGDVEVDVEAGDGP